MNFSITLVALTQKNEVLFYFSFFFAVPFFSKSKVTGGKKLYLISRLELNFIKNHLHK